MIALVAVVVSGLTFAGLFLTTRRAVDRDWMLDLQQRLTSTEDRLKAAEDRLLTCEKARADLAAENMALMRRALLTQQ